MRTRNLPQKSRSVNLTGFNKTESRLLGPRQITSNQAVQAMLQAERSPSGSRLLPHELTHVVQQGVAAAGRAGASVLEPALEGETSTSCSDSSVDDSPPDQARWTENEFLNKIRSEEPGGNRHLLSFGSFGEPVELVQQALRAWGCQTLDVNLLPRFGVDRSYKGETTRAVKRFQAEETITQDGIVGPVTLGRLDRFVGLGGLTGSPAAEFCTLFEPAADSFDSEKTFAPALAKTGAGTPKDVLPASGPATLCGPRRVCGCTSIPALSTTAAVGDDCTTKECAPAVFPAGSGASTGKLTCFKKGDLVHVLEVKPTVLGDGSRETFVLVQTEQLEPFLIRVRFLEGCAAANKGDKDKDKDKDKEKDKEKEKCSLPHTVLDNQAECASGEEFKSFDFPAVPSDKEKILKSFRKMSSKELGPIMKEDLAGLAGKSGTQAFEHFMAGSGTSLGHGEKSTLGGLAKTAPSFVKMREQVEQDLLGQVKTLAQSGAVDFCKLALAPIPLVNFRTGLFGGDPLALHAVIGGTQGIKIQLNSFSFDATKRAVTMGLRYRICDDFGVDLTDVTDTGIKGVSKSLKAFWVLQHERSGTRPFVNLIDLTVPFVGNV